MVELLNRKGVEHLYDLYSDAVSNIAAHLPTLRTIAAECDVVCEFGVERGRSTTALLLGARQHVHSWDFQEHPYARALEVMAGPAWSYTIKDSRKVEIPECDLLFIDSSHNGEDLAVELRQAARVRRFIVMHDTETFGQKGTRVYAPGQKPKTAPELPGLMTAIEDFLKEHDEWRMYWHVKASHGLTALRRRAAE